MSASPGFCGFLVSAPDFESGGQGFESLPARQALSIRLPCKKLTTKADVSRGEAGPSREPARIATLACLSVGGGNETARVHIGFRRRGSSVATRRPSAAP